MHLLIRGSGGGNPEMESSIDEGKRKWMPLLIRERGSRGRYIKGSGRGHR